MARTQLDLIRQGTGSGTDASKFLQSDGAQGWQMGTPSGGAVWTRVAVTGTQDGVNKVFTLGSTIQLDGAEEVYVNGLLLKSGSGNDYVVTTATQITFQTAMFAPIATDVIQVLANV